MTVDRKDLSKKLAAEYHAIVSRMEKLAGEIAPLQEELSKYFKHLPELERKFDTLYPVLEDLGPEVKAPSGMRWRDRHRDEPMKMLLQGYHYFDSHYKRIKKARALGIKPVRTDLFISRNCLTESERTFLRFTWPLYRKIAQKKDMILRQWDGLFEVKLDAEVKNIKLPEDQTTLGKLRALVKDKKVVSKDEASASAKTELKPVLSAKEFAEEIGKNPRTVKRYVEQGIIKANQNEAGRILGIPRSELDSFLKKTV